MGFVEQDLEPEFTLWHAVLEEHLRAAVDPWKLPNKDRNIPSLVEQYRVRRKNFKKAGRRIGARKHLHKTPIDTERSREFFCYSMFDDICTSLGYDNGYVEKVFNFVQEAITLEKKLFDEFSIQRSLF